MTKAELDKIIADHRLWLDGSGGRRANLVDACLRGANLVDASLVGANLRGANLVDASLVGANLVGACLRGANLRRACLRGANLRDACLRGANLRDASLVGANLVGTILDPSRTESATAEQLATAGLRIEGEYAYGRRTRISQHIGSTDYSTPAVYAAPVFSVCTVTQCHPGIYFGSDAWLDANDYSTDRVRCRALITDCIVAGGKIRARKIEVLSERTDK